MHINIWEALGWAAEGLVAGLLLGGGLMIVLYALERALDNWIERRATGTDGNGGNTK